MNKGMIIAIILFAIGNVLAWFQSNSQFIWKWWYDHPISTILIYSIPTSFAFFFGWRYAVESMGTLWSARMLGFGISTIIFGLMTYAIMEESITYKTAICLILAIAIILIQILWKN